MTTHEIGAVLASEPFLTSRGIEIHTSMTAARADAFLGRREELAGDAEGCTLAELWLKSIDKTVNITRRDSYGLKCMVEMATGQYVTNGAFIVAACHMGFRYVQVGDGFNARFNMGERSIKLAPDRIRVKDDGTVVETRRLKKAVR